MVFWELEGEVAFRKLLGSAAIVAGMAVSVFYTAKSFALDTGPVLAVRTDMDGHDDVIVLPERVPPRRNEAERFVEQIAIRMFGWDEDRKAANREFVDRRCSTTVRQQIRQLVPGYETSLRGEIAGRVDAEVEIPRVIGDRAPYQVEVVTGIEFSGEYLPPGLGERDPANARMERYAWMFTVSEVGRTEEAPEGLVVTNLARVTLGEV